MHTDYVVDTPFIFALYSRWFFFFFIWMAADVTGPLTDRYECLLWQENCCTIFLYWRWASYLNLVQSEDQRWVNKCHEQWAKPLNRSFVLKTNHCHFVNKETGSYAGICVGFCSRWSWSIVRWVDARSACDHCANASHPTRHSKDCCHFDHVILHHLVCA